MQPGISLLCGHVQVLLLREELEKARMVAAKAGMK